MPIVNNVRSTGFGGQELMCPATLAGPHHRRRRRRLVVLLLLCVVACVAAGELHPAEVVVNPIARRSDVFTSSFLVRFHRSVDGPEAHSVAIRNGFESVGAVSIYSTICCVRECLCVCV